jgi:hypothetical protein
MKTFIATAEMTSCNDRFYFVVAADEADVLPQIAAELNRANKNPRAVYVIVDDPEPHIVHRYTDPDNITMDYREYDTLEVIEIDPSVTQRINYR